MIGGPPTSGEPSFYGRPLVHLPSGTESAALDRRAIDEVGVPGAVLMENAGGAAARIVDRLHPAGPVVVLAGSGNNGGDGIVVARTLRARGRSVRLFVAGSRPDPEPLLHGWPIPQEEAVPDGAELREALAGSAVVVDALLGTGIHGSPRSPHAELIDAINRCGRPVLALDLPSGVTGDTGEAPGPAVRADATIAFGAPKVGSLRFPGRELSGRLIAVEIGFPPWDEMAVGARLITPGWATAHRPRRARVTHKNAAGRLLLVAGGEGMGGAAVLAARGALRAGVGYLRVGSVPDNRRLLQEAIPELVFVDVTDPDALRRAASASDAVAAGPGMGTGADAAERLGPLLDGSEPDAVLLDADALTLLAGGGLPGLPGARRPERLLLTPHPGEMSRLTGLDTEALLADPFQAARDEAERRGCAVLLKGNPSVVASADGAPLLVSLTSSSELARAGMGDVLTGVAGAFLARGVAAAHAGALALHFTGVAAAVASRGESLLPTDVSDALIEAMQAEGDGRSSLDDPSVILDVAPPR